jgi:hypothetical protein
VTATCNRLWASCVAHEARLVRNASEGPGAERTQSGPPPAYAKYNGHRGLGGQILCRPHEWLSLVFNNYGNGADDLGTPGRSRIHTEDSIEVRYYNKPDRGDKGVDKMAFSFTADAGRLWSALSICLSTMPNYGE